MERMQSGMWINKLPKDTPTETGFRFPRELQRGLQSAACCALKTRLMPVAIVVGSQVRRYQIVIG